ncbi:biotrophy-associated secreted protein 2 [Colletotrichum falcatum]|nr:biotrophy-associated secreted protein 2 [Colletotrichum falcatum]
MVRITLFATVAFAAIAFALSPNNAGARNVGKGDGSQFITGGCVDGADCSSDCCADLNGVGICSAEAAAFQAGKNGCGFVDPNKDETIAAAKAQVEKQGF